MKQNFVCTACGGSRTEDAPRGLCPLCLRKSPAAEGVAPIAAPAEGSAVAIKESSSPFAQRRVHFGDYELLGEIARGGMGVVYRARQISLNRVVAVKMILSGQLASEAEVKRFRIEAEAAANLRHPNIVAIHEIREQDGRHFFSMDFIEGRNLAEYARAQPLSASEIARLMSTLADAVHYAHQRGTLHRDLKPQNVVIDAQGQPHITDFGLAKRWNALTAAAEAPGVVDPADFRVSDGSSEVTTAGSIMGSPAYMGPEQAAGRLGEIAPATDVYSLGAILYRLLTGRPPHRGATPKDTLAKVINEEPTPPRRLKPDVPEDLETICLKCLEKQPQHRYATARALAEDLNRFAIGEPILAHPANPIRKAWSWTLRHPWVLVTGASVLLIGAVGAAFSAWEMMRFEQRDALLLRAEQSALTMPVSAKQRSAQYAEGMGYLQQALAIHEDGDVTRPAMNLLARSGKAWRRIEHSYGSNPAVIRRIISRADGRYLVVLTRQGDCEVFDVRARKSVFKVGTAGVANPLLAASEDGTWIAIADKGQSPGEVRLWHWTVNPDPVVLHASLAGVDAMSFSPVGLRLATAGVAEIGSEPEIQFWDVRQQRLVQTIPCFTNPYYRRKPENKIERLAFDPVGTQLEARNGANDVQYLQLATQWNVLEGVAAKQASEKFRSNNVVLRPWGVLQATAPGKNRSVAIRATGWDLSWRSGPPVFSKDRRFLAANFLVLVLQAPTEPLFLSEKIVRAISAVRGENLQAPASVAWQPVHLPARAVAVGPAGSWVTFDPAGSAFLLWRTEDVLAEWNRFELRDAMMAGTDRPAAARRRPVQSAPSIESQFHAEVFAGLFFAASFFCLAATSGIGAQAFLRKHRGLGPSRALLVLAAVLGTGAVALGLGATVRLVFVKVWDYPDSTALLVVAACYFVGWGVTMAIDAARSYHALLLGRSGADFRSTRFFYAALLIVIIAAVGKAIGHRSSELSSLLSAGLGAGILAGFLAALLFDLNSRVWPVRVLVSQAIAAVLAWLCAPDDPNVALMFACPLFLGFVVGGFLAGRVPARMQDWNVTAGEQLLAWVARRRKKLDGTTPASLPTP